MDQRARKASSRAAVAAQWNHPNAADLAAEAAAERYRSKIAEIVATAPPLTDEQRAELRTIIGPVIASSTTAPTTEEAAA
ncbi:MAG: hypothetical protein ABS81_15620 [Pseudonocardia sp. SCN 72-86]|nr:MAG: hypothetical protein ABS81_15620 [Pseudonocardia sp. SCN 72-86]